MVRQKCLRIFVIVRVDVNVHQSYNHFLLARFRRESRRSLRGRSGDSKTR